MQIKYPLKRKTFIGEEGRHAIPVIDLSAELENDILYQTKISFFYNERHSSYEKQIKLFLNKLVAETVAHAPRFRHLVRELFTLESPNGDRLLKHKIGTKFR